MIDNRKRAHELALIYMQSAVNKTHLSSPMDNKFIDFTFEYANAYLYIFDRLEYHLHLE